MPLNVSPYRLQDKPQTMIEHLTELRKRLLYTLSFFCLAFAVSFFFKEHIFSMLALPLTEILTKTGGQFIYTSLPEAFTTYLKLCFMTAFAVSLPIILTQGWLFVAPALYRGEKKLSAVILLTSPILFLGGAYFAYKFIMPQAWAFFLNFEVSSMTAGVPLKLQAKISKYLSLTTQILFAFGLSFQLPLIMILLGKLGLVKASVLLKGRKYALLIIMIVSAFLTPPDVLSMLGLTLPLYILYELSAQILRFMGDPDDHRN